jgi:hypothetical protein
MPPIRNHRRGFRACAKDIGGGNLLTVEAGWRPCFTTADPDIALPFTDGFSSTLFCRFAFSPSVYIFFQTAHRNDANKGLNSDLSAAGKRYNRIPRP